MDTEPEPSYIRAVTPDPSASQAEVQRLQQENAQLKAELTRLQAHRISPVEAATQGFKFARLLVPLLDRQKIVRNFIALFETTTQYAGPKEQWPTRETVLHLGQELGVSIVQFLIRRRTFYFAISLIALIMPLTQVWLVFRQNEIIENQNKYFNIQVYDIVGRSITASDSTTGRMASALLAEDDFKIVEGIVLAVFDLEAKTFDIGDKDYSNRSFLEETQARGNLISALERAVRRHADETSHGALWASTRNLFTKVCDDAGFRLLRLLRLSKSDTARHQAASYNAASYLVNLVALLRTTNALARSADEEDAYFELITPLIKSISRLSNRNKDSDYRQLFVDAFPELLLDLALKPELGRSSPIPDEAEPVIRQGLLRLVEQVKKYDSSLNSKTLESLFLEN